jgi:CBS-domain-containing membrane protein
MTRSVRSCGPDDTLEQAARLMWEADVGCLPVLDEEGRPIGMITDRDMCMAAYTQGVALRDSKVSSAMSHSVITCSPESSIADVEALMRNAQIRRVPVVDFSGSLAGIVTLGDIARYSQSSPLHVPAVPGVAKTFASILQPRAAQPVAAE